METNKILGAIILALLLAAVFSKVADMAIHPEFPDELAYKIEVPEGGVSSEIKEEVNIFEVLPKITPMLASASMENGEKIFKKCASCHTQVKGGENKVGPAMWGIVNRSKGSMEGFAYSGALVELEIVLAEPAVSAPIKIFKSNFWILSLHCAKACS